MAFISSERVAEIRKQLKSEFPNLKLSITCRHNSTVCVSIMEGQIDFINDDGTNYVQPIRINDDWSKNIQARDILLKIKDIVTKDIRIVSEDTDYGNVPNYYYNISVGKWDKPYIFRKIGDK